jgi:hypothetical protein
MILEGVRIGANAVRSWLQRRKQKKAERKAAKAEAKASALEKKLFEKISPGDSLPSKMSMPVFASVGVQDEKPGLMGVLQKYWPIAAGLAGLFFVLSFFRKRRR